MEALVKKDISKINIDNKDDIKEVYELIKDDIKVGYCLLKNNTKEEVQIFINEEYRSNGYGKLFFGKILDMLNKDVYLKTNNENMICIIKYYNGKELSRNKGIISFVIPKRG